ncbi:uncharacterized protein LOC132628351 [Lycium barbarum]|uniref:uncharacterized protein LOC132628351 n=1 Tax=Lycium barbarum TaxID=112863 RepID=UPI00293E1054|nr:uncharacterized protein LOC132628351 [Lycium barbarum]
MNQIAVNTVAGGCFMDNLSLAVVTKENHERDHSFAQFQTTVDLLSKKLAEKDAQGVIDLEPIVEKEAQPNVSDVIVEDEIEEEIPIIAEDEHNLENSKPQGGKNEKGKAKLSRAFLSLTQLFKSLPPFPQRLFRKIEDEKCLRFYDQLKQLTMNISFRDAVQEMLGFAQYFKDLLTKKKKLLKHDTALCDNGASINLMPLEIFKRSGLGMPRPTTMRLQMADRSIKRPFGVVDDVLVRVGEFLP